MKARGGDGVSYGRLSPGDMVQGRYRIGGVVGRGGTGIIYEAEDLHQGRRVAIKTLDADLLAHPSAVARYQREARTAGAIGHPNICRVFDAGQLPDGRPFLTMELLTGTTLAARIRADGALPFADAVSVQTQVLSALDAGHAQMIVHRDIKPDNVFLTDRIQGVLAVKILDFGIAKSLDTNAELSLTRTGMVVGTPFYMAPEQAKGDTIDHRVDLYACGVMFYEMLTGRRPFHASNYNALMLQVLTSEPRDPREIRPAIPAGFVRVVDKAMRKDPQERYQDASSFLADLWQLQATVSQGPGPEEIARIARAVRGGESGAVSSVDAQVPDDAGIPVYLDSEPPQRSAAEESHPDADDDVSQTQPFDRPEHLEALASRPPPAADDDAGETRPFVRPEQVAPKPRPPRVRFPLPTRESIPEPTEVMLIPPSFSDDDDGDEQTRARAPAPPKIREDESAWDDEQTRADSSPPIPPEPSKRGWDDEPTRVDAPATAEAVVPAPTGKVPRPGGRVPRPKPKR